MCTREVGKFHQIFFSLLDHNPFKINFIDLSPALSGSLCGFWFIVMDKVLVTYSF